MHYLGVNYLDKKVFGDYCYEKYNLRYLLLIELETGVTLNQRRGQSRKKKPNCIDHFTCAEEAEGSPFVSLFFPSTYHKYCISNFDGHLSKNYSS